MATEDGIDGNGSDGRRSTQGEAVPRFSRVRQHVMLVQKDIYRHHRRCPPMVSIFTLLQSVPARNAPPILPSEFALSCLLYSFPCLALNIDTLSS